MLGTKDDKYFRIKLLGLKITITKDKIFSIKDTHIFGRRIIYFMGIKITYKRKKNYLPALPESVSAHKYLDGLRGIEIGGASYNPWGLNTLNCDFIDHQKINTNYNNATRKYYNIEPLKVDIITFGDDLPFKDNTWDFVINSHVLEHFWDPIKALNEWMRVINGGGYLYMNIPHKDRTRDKERPVTTIDELIYRHNHPEQAPDPTIDCHHNVWRTEDFLNLCKYLKLNVIYYNDVDDKDGIGFTVIIQKQA